MPIYPYHDHDRGGPLGFGESSAVAMEAYQGRTALYDERLDRLYDYRHLGDHVAGGVLIPEGAPEAYLDPAYLWNQAQMAGFGSPGYDTARPSWTVVGALPRELSQENQIDMARSFLQHEVVDPFGVAASWHVHQSVSDIDGLPRAHFHAQLSIRALGPDGFGEKVFEPSQHELRLGQHDAFAAEQSLALEDELDMEPPVPESLGPEAELELDMGLE